MSPVLDPKKSALLVMDYQDSVVAMFPEGAEAALERVAQALDAARAAGMRVIHVVIGFRPGHPEIGSGNKSFQALKGSGRFEQGSAGSGVHPRLAPRDGDWTVVKRRVSAFAGSDLDMLLRAQGVETLALAGVATSGVVLSTLRQAADLDYRLIVLRDACLDRDAEVHACLMDKVFPGQAEVLEVGRFKAELEKP